MLNIRLVLWTAEYITLLYVRFGEIVPTDQRNHCGRQTDLLLEGRRSLLCNMP